MAYSDRTYGNGPKLKEGRFGLEIRKRFFTVKVVKPWHGLTRKAVAVPFLVELKLKLDGTLSKVV